MIIIRGIDKIRKFKKPVLAIGVFDGVHRGHVKILRAVVAKARRIGGTSMAMTFWPHPQEEGHLYSLRHRLELVSGCGIDACVVIDFNKKFARISARDFVKNILVEKIRPSYVYVGRNFNFGRGGYGGLATLQALSKIYKFGLRAFAVLKINGRPVSSTHIRALIHKGRLKAAALLLGRPVSILGTVTRGCSIGRRLGFPTANIDPHHEVIPPPGVYAVRAIVDGKNYHGVCNIGRRPTFSSGRCRHTRKESIEAYIFDFHKNIYHKYFKIRFIKKLRNERKFSSSARLAAQIQRDVLAARRLFSRH